MAHGEPTSTPTSPTTVSIGESCNAINGRTYTVMKEDTLWTIANREQIELSALLSANLQTDLGILEVGQMLCIPPVRHTQPSSSAPPVATTIDTHPPASSRTKAPAPSNVPAATKAPEPALPNDHHAVWVGLWTASGLAIAAIAAAIYRAIKSRQLASAVRTRAKRSELSQPPNTGRDGLAQPIAHSPRRPTVVCSALPPGTSGSRAPGDHIDGMAMTPISTVGYVSVGPGPWVRCRRQHAANGSVIMAGSHVVVITECAPINDLVSPSQEAVHPGRLRSNPGRKNL